MVGITGFPIKECRISLLGSDIRIVFIQGLYSENTAFLSEALMKLLILWEPGTVTFPRGTNVIVEAVAEYRVSELIIISNDIGGGTVDHGMRVIPFGEGLTVWLGCSLELWARLQTRNAAWIKINAYPEPYGFENIWQFVLEV